MEAVFMTSVLFIALNTLMRLLKRYVCVCVCVCVIHRYFKDTRDLEDTEYQLFAVEFPLWLSRLRTGLVSTRI